MRNEELTSVELHFDVEDVVDGDGEKLGSECDRSVFGRGSRAT